ncbi:MAG TPA: hypothetical protein VHB79_04800 [Polyangiaceae bacterium]|nr:hypothetical protein [Polyangiaceae bacterium]
MKQVDEEQELTRLLAAEPSPLAPGLEALREHGPDAAELASLASRLALQGIDVSIPPPAPPRANPWKKWAWGGSGGVAAGLIWLALRGAQPAPTASLPSAPTPELPGASAFAAEPAPVSQRSAKVAAEQPKTVDNAPAATSALATATSRRPATPPPASEEQERPTAANASNPSHDSANVFSHPLGVSSHTESTSTLSSSASASAPSPVATQPATELELLRDARFALRQSPARALQLTDEHARAYPQGKMTQERELIAVSALVALGRRTAALSRAASFERLYPKSPYRKQMGDLLR